MITDSTCKVIPTIAECSVATMELASVKLSSKVEEVTSLMLLHGYSQIPVKTKRGVIKGVITWKSLAKMFVSDSEVTSIKEFMEPLPPIVQELDSLLDVLKLIDTHEFVLVQDKNDEVTGIITAYDIAKLFETSTKGFLLIGEIEENVRLLLNSYIDINEVINQIDTVCSKQVLTDFSDLTFGQYVRILENKSNWDKISLNLDRKAVVKQLQLVNEVRNGIMHFRYKRQSDEQILLLEETQQFFVDLKSLLEQ